MIEKSVLYYGVIVAILYILYSCTLNHNDVYKYAMYLIMLVVLILLDTILLKKQLKYNNTIQILILSIYMLIMTGEYITIATFVFVVLLIGIKNMIQWIMRRRSVKVMTKKQEQPIVLYMCVANIIMLISTNFLLNCMIK